METGTSNFRCRTGRGVWVAVLCVLTSGLSVQAIPQGERGVAGSQQDILSPDLRQWLNDQLFPVQMGVTSIPPQIFRDADDGTLTGLCIDFIREIETHLNYSFDIVFYDTWNEMMQAAFSREIDVIYAAQKTPSRLGEFDFSDPYLTFENKIIATEDVQGPLTLDDLADQTVAVVRGAAIEEYLTLHYPQIRLLQVDDELIGLSRVSFNQADAMVIEIARASWYIQQNKFTNLHIVGNAAYPYVLGFACRSDRPELVEILNAAMAQIPPSRRNAIVNRWILPLEHKGADMRFLLLILAGFAVVLLAVFVWNRMLSLQVRRHTVQLQSELQAHQKDISALRRYETIISLSEDQMVFVDADYVFRAANDAYLKAVYRTRNEVIGHHIKDVVGQDFFERYICERLEKAFTGQTVSFELWVELQRHGLRYLQGVYHPHCNGSGAIEGVVIVIHDITEREKNRNDLEENQQAMSRLFANLRGIAYRCKYDKDWPMEFLSQGCEELTGYSDREFYRGIATWADLIVQEDREYVWQEISRQVSRGERFQIEYRIRDRTGRLKWFWEKGCGVFDHNGQILAIEGFITDITDRKQAEKMKERLLKEVRSKNEELESIVFIASHDLRSPLVNIRGFAGELEKSVETLKDILNEAMLSRQTREKLDPILDSEISESLYFIKNGTKKANTLLNGLLRLSRIGTAQIKPTTVNINTLVNGILSGLRFTIRENRIDISVEGDLPACRGDITLITQIFENLIDNAIKYRRPDQPSKIRIRGRRDNGQCLYQIEDNGVGISAEHLEKVFEIFHQLRPGCGGEGLGLTIVRRILDRQDGRIQIESEVNKGTTVSITLPPA